MSSNVSGFTDAREQAAIKEQSQNRQSAALLPPNLSPPQNILAAFQAQSSRLTHTRTRWWRISIYDEEMIQVPRNVRLALKHGFRILSIVKRKTGILGRKVVCKTSNRAGPTLCIILSDDLSRQVRFSNVETNWSQIQSTKRFQRCKHNFTGKLKCTS